MNDDKYYKINEKINNFNYNKEIKNIIDKDIIINKEEKIMNNYNTYKNVTSFSSLFVSRTSRNAQTVQPPMPSTPAPSKPTTQTSQNTSVVQTQPTTTPNVTGGRTYDANRMWSPQSFAGKIYEWNRGVIGISLDGTMEKESLDGTLNHHSDATVRVVNALGSSITDNGMPFQMGVDGANEGIVVFQSEGDNGLVYFPENISAEQLNGLMSIITPRSSFNFSYTHGEEVFEDQTNQDVLAFATNISVLANSVRR